MYSSIFTSSHLMTQEPRTLQLMELQTPQQMEPQQQQPTEEGGNTQAAGSSANMDFWRSRTRWIPTPEQIRILKDLYYVKGFKCPSTEHIHEICLQLNQYGHVEGKNIYFWFQNVRAREKQMNRCNQAAPVPMGTSSLGTGGSIDLNFGSTGSTGAGGSIDINFGPAGGSIDINFGSTSSTDDGRSIDLNFGSTYSTGGQTSLQQRGGDHQEVQTLPLFPVHGEDVFGNLKTTSEEGSAFGYYSGGSGGYHSGSNVSLELSLNPSGAAD
ncbi:protein WUSCHEL-like [Rosa rugosa]|uniref:protein WUSCHEL-like n=2 Tax=Rosa rugosa TaxID=74645 RepID=UPI002B402D57|nr:protein WUSCHEL-like [Rosa rugosa]XP_061995895.1 protein WUSCHEL-like [Rosa rugosa]XP_061995896.1 protein WUSCHEL-like [Rosa rugosa]XP_062001188.1 protein WUSCHEL-like [Rosa rugosa]XP_062001462.1 protein WUSCHEL-like [Rosa rugosa]XP_062001759.1 protein WUSCHEL-like [Rosa rugosa]XP_062007113.1 protein WUSCHEL-like [Rosa rugosa]XP_062011989.1 protein WUSCHEL-like [Rosa rugosa]XP_062012976.1 protein WUSCHEL-like [Rosa rugosa]XP_062013541.1 protein WUSCHEL-like [Rosa rugosa]XP_062018590.1 